MGDDTAVQLGSIVAFDGDAETISTQLRLIPTSPQILILPNIQSYLPTDTAEQDDFRAHWYIHSVHTAARQRHETAQKFLRGSTLTSRRLVFLHGGSPGAQALCIRALMQHETHGDMADAEALFNHLAKEGLTGLEEQYNTWNQRPVDGVLSKLRCDTDNHELEDPITRAMRAAEALDRSTANLQPSNDIDLTIARRHRSRSLSLPMYGYSDDYGDAAPFYVFGVDSKSQRKTNSGTPVRKLVKDALIPPVTRRFSVTHFDNTFDPPRPVHCKDPLVSPNCAGEAYDPTYLLTPVSGGLQTPKSDRFSPSAVAFGEASVIDMRSHNPHTLTRVKSVDRFNITKSGSSPFCPERDVMTGLSSPLSPSTIVSRDSSTFLTHLTMSQTSRTVLVQPRQSIITVSPAPRGKNRHPQPSGYVDRGTDAELCQEEEETSLESGTRPFLPILPVSEDLVIHFKNDASDAVLEAVILAYKNGTYPVVAQSPDNSETNTIVDQLPSTPRFREAFGVDITNSSPDRDLSSASPSLTETDEYDPFAYTQPAWVHKPPKLGQTTILKIERPPTPEKTPVVSVSDWDDKFHDFEVSDSQTAVQVQNSLRSVLNLYFPPGIQGYRQFSFPVLPELEGLWKPIFRGPRPGSHCNDDRRLDQILAVGSHNEVKKEYSSSIIGQLNRIGVKLDGTSRSGRLDFRYLLANAMQAFTAQPLSKQTSDNPFQNPYLLAALIVPHLETYLALHTEVRYLILEYPPEHLPTVLALQKLVGLSLLKVAQIVECEDSSFDSLAHFSGQSMGLHNDKSNNPQFGRFTSLVREVTMSKANFLVTSSASDDEIASFINTVRKVLSEVSQFYMAEQPAKSVKTPKSEVSEANVDRNKRRPAPLSPTFSAFPKTTGLQSPTLNNIAGLSPPFVSPTPSTRAASIAETIRTFKSGKSRGGRSKSRKRPPTSVTDKASMLTYDPAEDSDYDMEERRLMPMFMQKPKEMQMPNTRKALKFLGLA